MNIFLIMRKVWKTLEEGHSTTHPFCWVNLNLNLIFILIPLLVNRPLGDSFVLVAFAYPYLSFMGCHYFDQ